MCNGVTRPDMIIVRTLVPALLLLLCWLVAACDLGAATPTPLPQPRSTPTVIPTPSAEVRAGAFLQAWKDRDGAAMSRLLAGNAGTFFGDSVAKWLADQTHKYGTPIQGELVRRQPMGKTYQLVAAMAYDCQAEGCRSNSFTATWAPAGSYILSLLLTLQEDDEGWFITHLGLDDYPTREATMTAVALTPTASPSSTRLPTGTPTPVPTQSPTPLPKFISALTAYQALDIEGKIKASGLREPILFRVFNRCLENECVTKGFTDVNLDLEVRGFLPWQNEPYSNPARDGTSSQWLFFFASTLDREVRLLRVFAGRLDPPEPIPSGQFYDQLFTRPGTSPQPLKLQIDDKWIIDSDKAMQEALEHGYRARAAGDVVLQLGAEDPPAGVSYRPARLAWTLYGDEGKMITLDPVDGSVISNDF